MAKQTVSYCCSECGTVFPKWVGKCTACGNWNTVIEDSIDVQPNSSSFSKVSHKAQKIDLKYETLSDATRHEDRIVSENLSELNRVLGGGIVNGSAILIGGEPGVGKSTLLLQIATSVASLESSNVVYASGEESANQIIARAKRMHTETAPVKLLLSTNVSYLLSAIGGMKNGDILIVDSIQTAFLDDIQSTPGSIVQVRTCAHELIVACKAKGVALFLVGHINKEGQIAGPKVLEHMVDVVLYFEEDNTHQYRILRNIKNRFGSIQEVGIYAMHSNGLREIPNPSELFLSHKKQDEIGSTVFAGIEGSRPFLAQVETLISPSYMSAPRRSVVGWNPNRLAMIIAVLSSHMKMKLYDKEVYLNIAGGLKTEDHSLDLTVAMCLYSSTFEVAIPNKIACFGEIGLSGEVRAVQFMDQRIKEAAKLGFTRIICPKLQNESEIGDISNCVVTQISYVTDIRKVLGFAKKDNAA